MKEVVAEAIQSEIRSALEDELIDVEHAAGILGMSPGALRKAVKRGQVPCQRIGNRLPLLNTRRHRFVISQPILAVDCLKEVSTNNGQAQVHS